MRLHSQRTLAWLVGLAFLAAATLASADDNDDAMGGFDDDAEEIEVEFDTTTTDEADRWWNIDGSIGISSSVNWNDHRSVAGSDYDGLSRLRTRLNLEFDADLPWGWKFRASPHIWYDFAYLINGFSNYTSQVRNDYEWEVDFQDTFLEGPILENLDLKIGRQVVKWGRADSVRVLDVLNPLDQREPARADIEDLARSVGMAKLDWYVDRNWTITAIAIPEIRFNDNPSFGSDFNPSPVDNLEQSPNDLSNWEGAASARGIFEGWDISFHYAYIYNDLPTARIVGPPPAMGAPPIFKGVHNRLHLAGAGGNYTFGSFLVKAEVAYLYGFEFAGVNGEHSRVDAMLGIEYYGITDHTFAIEVAERHLFNHVAAIRAGPNFTRKDSVEYALRWTADWFNARLTTTALVLLLGPKVQDGVILRAQGKYEIASGLAFTAGLIMYQAGHLPPIDSWGLNDRVFFDLKYSF